MDYNKFEKLVKKGGYSIGHSTNHHTIEDATGKIVGHFAVRHKKGAKDYVKDVYVKKIRQSLGI